MAHGEVRPHVFEETEGDTVDGGHVYLAFFYHRHAPQMSAAKLDLGKERSLPRTVAFVLLVHQLSEEVTERVHTAAHSCSKRLALFKEAERGWCEPVGVKTVDGCSKASQTFETLVRRVPPHNDHAAVVMIFFSSVSHTQSEVQCPPYLWTRRVERRRWASPRLLRPSP